MRWFALSLAFLILPPLLISCTSSTPTPTPTATFTSTPTPSPTFTPAATATPGSSVLTPVQVVKKVLPSVVNIVSESVQLDMFLRPVPVEGAGTGIVFDKAGHIITNNHVVENANKITVNLPNGESHEANLVGGDAYTDLAVIKIEAAGLTPAQIGDSSALEVGETVVAIGHAFNLPGGPTVTEGVVSAKEREIQESADVTLVHVIQTDAAINPGNSGGPLLNMRGELVGINSAGMTSGEGLGFAISINGALSIIEDLIQYGEVQRASLGVQGVTVTASMAQQYSLPVSQGVVVTQVQTGSAADLAGLKRGDLIVNIGDNHITNNSDLARTLQGFGTGDRAKVTFYRGGGQQQVEVTFQ